jgi:transposase InsO family protein
MSELCEANGISRKTGYKWLKRYQKLGAKGLEEMSRKPSQCPHKTPYRIRKEVVDLRRKHGWGASKLLAILKGKHPKWELPARSTVCEILRKEGLVSPPKRRKRLFGTTRPFLPVNEPNDVWTADFKGQFRLRSGTYCYPLTIADAYSRFLLDCRSLKGTTFRGAKSVFTGLFQEYGMPERIRTDNGIPFAAMSVGGLSRLSIWWIHLGIVPERIQPGKPQQKGSHERMHRALKEKTALRPSRSFNAQQKRFDAFREEYNEVRPHESLNMKTPSCVYYKSKRPMPKDLPELEYPSHFERNFVNHNGIIYKKNKKYYIGYILRGELVGLNAISDGIWDVYIGPVLLGRLDERKEMFVNLHEKPKVIKRKV